MKVPTAHRELALMACREHLNVHRLHELRDTTVHDLLARFDAFRKPDRIAQLAIACEADKRGRAGLPDELYPQRAELLRWHAAALADRKSTRLNSSLKCATTIPSPALKKNQ